MAESTDYYRVLGVDEMSSHEEIKQAYRVQNPFVNEVGLRRDRCLSLPSLISR